MSRERGAGLFGTIGAVLVFLVLLTFAVQLLVNLYATSAITAAGHDAAHMVASGFLDETDESSVHRSIAEAESRARAVLGRYGDRVSFRWTIDDDHVAVTITATHPPVAMERVSAVFGLNRVERTVTVRREQIR
ncbi:MAG: hypothetical protein ACXIVQ_05380 [Acidimicrobiales bacterium]